MAFVHETLTALVSGRVQRVGFRQFAAYHAMHYQLRGWARNREDGTVEVVVQGPRPQIEAFLARLRQGTTLARVTQIDQTWGPRPDVPEGFEIR